ncbi:helix-turn-helix domain-containing protein [Pseudoduganella eburnea]|uniref:Helix-turn-helix domain-containing protein n=1 Tax=Massilia eburnea TaxID=1776165 RepID=A0A6L6QCN6_9BURK|nr:GlxA family transcriptional regulator [Massilia eburnea]MTW09567.1 helix-turn-helix domain-containing protein [Massilia eburnea]
MTNTPEFLPTSRLVLFLAYEEVGLFDLTGPQTVFWAADKRLRARGQAGYVLHTASVSGGLVGSAEGLAIMTEPLDAFDPMDVDTIVVPGSPHMPRIQWLQQKLTDWLRQASSQSRRTVSVCSGTFLLAQAGLLNGKRAATHWAMCDLLRERFPSVEVDSDAIFVRQQAVWTSAGVSAGVDLALALVEADCGHAIAMQVARELVVFLKRPGGQAQFSELLLAQSEEGELFERLHLWIMDNLTLEPMSVEVMAERVNMSPRNFARVYKQKTGRTPAKGVEVLRIEAARRMLEGSPRKVEQIARLCGFGNEERLRSVFQRTLGVAPRDYRRCFAVKADSSV